MKTFFISDIHIGHKNCLQFDNRPFKDLEEQNERLIEIWNSRVAPSDTVWILGDVLWNNDKETIDTIKNLNGRKCLVSGNHDHRWLKYSACQDLFDEIYDGYHRIRIDNKTIILSHYPIIMFDGVIRGNIHLYGHIHINKTDCYFIEKWKTEYENEMKKRFENFKVNMYNVGFAVPYMEWGPKTLDEIIEVNR